MEQILGETKMIKEKEFLSMLWKKFQWYRKMKGGVWYQVSVPPGSVTDGFNFWSRFPPDMSWGEGLVSKEEYK
jgi:hypothetical protein